MAASLKSYLCFTMRLVCSQSELSNGLQLASRAVAARPTHPVLANILLSADASTNKLHLTGFDLVLGIQTSMDASVEASGAITLPTRLFTDIIAKLPSNSSITIENRGEEEVEITSLSGTYHVTGIIAEDFPDLPFNQSGQPIQIEPSSLLQGLKATVFASSADESKQILTGVNLHLTSNGLKCAATDGHRLAIFNASAAINDLPDDEFTETVPARSLRELERLLTGATEPINIYSDLGQLVVWAGNNVLTTKTLVGTYPNYQQLIPGEFKTHITLDRKALIAGLERVAIFAEQHTNVIKVNADPEEGLITLSCDAQEVGNGVETMAAITEGDSIQIAFNARYLVDGLKAIKDAECIVLRCNAPTTPAVIYPLTENEEDTFKYLVMPVQVRG